MERSSFRREKTNNHNKRIFKPIILKKLDFAIFLFSFLIPSHLLFFKSPKLPCGTVTFGQPNVSMKIIFCILRFYQIHHDEKKFLFTIFNPLKNKKGLESFLYFQQLIPYFCPKPALSSKPVAPCLFLREDFFIAILDPTPFSY